MIKINNEKLKIYQEILTKTPLVFSEEDHGYMLYGKKVPSVSAILKEAGISPDFSGVAPEVLERARARGEAVHLQVAEALRKDAYEFCEQEALEVLTFLKKFFPPEKKGQWTNIISEGFIFSENDIKNYCGRFDLLAEKDGEFFLYDIKTAKNESMISRNSARWQLNFYAYALKEEFGINVKEMAVLRFEFFEGEPRLKVEKVDFIGDEKITELLRAGKVESPLVNLTPHVVKMFLSLAEKQEEVKRLEEDLKVTKDAIYNFMKDNDILSTESEDGVLKITRVADSESISVDYKKMQAEEREIFEKYKKITPRKGYIKISLKKE